VKHPVYIQKTDYTDTHTSTHTYVCAYVCLNE
jgi:hypothetical protein